MARSNLARARASKDAAAAVKPRTGGNAAVETAVDDTADVHAGDAGMDVDADDADADVGDGSHARAGGVKSNEKGKGDEDAALPEIPDCDICEDDTATMYCHGCKKTKFLCDSCCASSHKSDKKKGHTILTVQEHFGAAAETAIANDNGSVAAAGAADAGGNTKGGMLSNDAAADDKSGSIEAAAAAAAASGGGGGFFNIIGKTITSLNPFGKDPKKAETTGSGKVPGTPAATREVFGEGVESTPELLGLWDVSRRRLQVASVARTAASDGSLYVYDGFLVFLTRDELKEASDTALKAKSKPKPTEASERGGDSFRIPVQLPGLHAAMRVYTSRWWGRG